MFADIVGYTALMQRAEAEAIAAQKRFQRTIEGRVAEAHGEVVQVWGDGALTIFPSAVEATRCALEVQRDFRQDPAIPVRVGVHVGDIVRDGDGAWGDGVNVSARIQALATPGSVLISKRVADELKNQEDFRLASLGPFHLKNVAEPVSVFALDDDGLHTPTPDDLRRATAADGDSDTEAVSVGPSGLRSGRWRGLAVAALVLAVLASGTAWVVYRQARVQWARDVALPRVESLVAQRRYGDAVALAQEAAELVPTEPRLAALWPRMSRPARITATPSGTRISMARVPEPSVRSERSVTRPDEWLDLGPEPVVVEHLPLGSFRLRFVAEGHDTVVAIYQNLPDDEGRTQRWWASLDPMGTTPPGWARIGPKRLSVSLNGMPPDFHPGVGLVPDPTYLLARREVTNREYKAFIDAGGYENPDLWRIDVVDGGQVLDRAEAMSLFRDRSGRPGPSTWEGGTYPAGWDEHPVGGLSWYEAAAYAEFVGASLPTLYHWYGAAENRGFDMAGFGNFRGQGPDPVGAAPFGPFGVYDLAGNVREWVWNRTGDNHYVLGGGWSDPMYMYGQGSVAPPLDRSPTNGIRLADFEGTSDEALAPFRAPIDRSYVDFAWGAAPRDDAVFQVLAGQYDYDAGALDADIEAVDDSNPYWIRERVSFAAAYDGERVPGDLFLPKNVEPPYQTLVFFPGAASIRPGSSERLDGIIMIDHVVKTGRAVFHPIYKDTYERHTGLGQNREPTRVYVDRKIRWIQDVRRSVDYLETRTDIDHERIGYWGLSWGAEHGPIVLATEERLRAGVLMDGGALFVPVLPEADESRFAPYVTVPVLMINGTFDFIFPVETTQRPFFELLGTPAADKTHVLFESGHVVVNRHFDDAMGVMVRWLDERFGPVR